MEDGGGPAAGGEERGMWDRIGEIGAHLGDVGELVGGMGVIEDVGDEGGGAAEAAGDDVAAAAAEEDVVAVVADDEAEPASDAVGDGRMVVVVVVVALVVLLTHDDQRGRGEELHCISVVGFLGLGGGRESGSEKVPQLLMWNLARVGLSSRKDKKALPPLGQRLRPF